MPIALSRRILSHLLQQIGKVQHQLQQAYDFGTRLQLITEKVRDSLDEAQILQTAVRELGIGLGVDSCDTGIYDLEKRTSTIAYEYVASQGQVLVAQGIAFNMADYAEIYQLLLQGQPLQFCWLPSDGKNPSNIRCIRDRFTVLVHPIVDNQQVIGDLWLYRVGDNQGFSTEESWLAQQVATQCAIAIRQARLYQAAQAQVTELARLNRLKDDFLSTISHELRTPISNVAMAVQMLEIQLEQAQITPQNETVARYLKLLKQESQREIALINDLLMLSRLEAETDPLMLTTIEPHVWIPHVIEPFMRLAEAQQQQIQLDIPDRLPPITTDLTDLERILTELLTNACKYTPAGETIIISATLEPTVASRNPNSLLASTLTLTICNTGIELPNSECERIFDKFYRVPSSDPWKHGGVGLGLALVKKLATRLGASIQAQSSTGQLQFILQLPLQWQRAI